MSKEETQTYKRLKNKKQDNYPKYLIIHHTGGTDKNPLTDTSKHTAKDIERWHLSKGWEGLGYQYVAHKDGKVWKGRPEFYHGAHCSKYNKKSIGICMSGNFDLTLPTAKQEASMKILIKDIQTRYPNIIIKYHRDFARKSCPGNNIKKDWIKSLLEEEMIRVPKRILLELKKYI